MLCVPCDPRVSCKHVVVVFGDFREGHQKRIGFLHCGAHRDYNRDHRDHQDHRCHRDHIASFFLKGEVGKLAWSLNRAPDVSQKVLFFSTQKEAGPHFTLPDLNLLQSDSI